MTPTALYATAILAILVGALLATYRALKGPEVGIYGLARYPKKENSNRLRTWGKR